MKPEFRRLSGVLALVVATQVFSACNTGMRLGADKTGNVPAAAEAKTAAGAGSAPAKAPALVAAQPDKPDKPEEDEDKDVEAGSGDKAETKAETKVEPAPNSCISSKCHTTILLKGKVHDVAEGCTDCHEELSTPHPSKGVKTFGLINDLPDLCYTCHDEFGKEKTVHSPVGDGACTDCHNPHSTAEAKLLIKPVGELCKECHEGPTDHAKLHGPVADGDCIACHNPHQTNTPTLLVKEVPALCVECHTDMEDELKKKLVHSPLESDGCVACHDPHGSAHDKMLSASGKDVCFSCHDTKADEINNAKVSHGAMDDDKGCMLCHSPHASDNASLLVKPTRDVCLECHDTDAPPKAAFLHGKKHDGNCAECHTPHGGDVERLLVAEFPDAKYQSYTDKSYPLCFTCHEREMVTARETSSATGFRDGKRNMHSVHVDDGEKGRTCQMCHSVHGSAQPKLIQHTIPFGKWEMQLKFVKTETGGGCTPGCHRPKFYDREEPGRKPPGTKNVVNRGA